MVNESTREAPANVLVVDDEPSICWAIERLLVDRGHTVHVASSAEQGLSFLGNHHVDLVFLDVRLPKEDGISALPKVLELSGQAPVILMTAFGDLETAVAAVQNGATDYLTKPFDLADIERTFSNALLSKQSTPSRKVTRSKRPADDQLVGRSPAMQLIYKQIAFVATSDLAVLITGETGTGKELVASAIHRHSHRREQAYLPVSPAAFNPELIESELFGHMRGAFTGAHDDRIGVFEQAEGGTVLLDEIGDLPLGAQVKLLRVLERGEFSRVGEARLRTCNVRILAATNCDLQAAVQSGRFREDLFYRLNGLQMKLPPLADRLEDIEPLILHFLERLNYENSAPINRGLLEDLKRRPWKGNVRELRNAVEHAAVLARGRSLTSGDFPPPQQSLVQTSHSSSTQDLESSIQNWWQANENQQKSNGMHTAFLAEVEPLLIRLAMQQTGGNRTKAADLLGIHRATLREKMRTQNDESE